MTALNDCTDLNSYISGNICGTVRCARRLAGELLRLSDPVRTQWQPLLAGWYDNRGTEVLGSATFR